ncbi:MAG: glycoside hydrolase family 30 protein [Bacteroidales bacterium]|nr:glycoside hydrolase family 30 protein [Bacteroidales bacterium]
MHLHSFAILVLAVLTACRGGLAPEAPAEEVVEAATYTTSVDGLRFEPGTVRLMRPGAAAAFRVTLTGETFQTIDGFGLALTQASCYHLLQMPAADRAAFLRELFERGEGLGSSLIRVCIGGSDFSMDEFSWCDEPGMEHFGVHPLDTQYLFPILDEIYAINPDVQIIGSPWSCPRWMKVAEDGSTPHNDWVAGHLGEAYYRDYADYFVGWIREMQRRGYKVMGVTLQNEPLHRGNSMSTYMSWQEQSNFIKWAVGPAFAAAGLKTKVLVYDHNYNYDNNGPQQDYPLHIFEDPEANRFVAGSAWHNYGGTPAMLDGVHERFPDKDIYFTEASIGTWNYKFEDCLINDFRDIFLGTLGRWGRGVTLWNLMLDYQGKPFRPRGCSTCYGAVSISATDHTLGSIVRNSHYYDVAHCSKVLQPGAVRLGTTGYRATGLTYQLYRNPDGSYAALILNEGGSEAQVCFVTDKYSVACRVPARAVQSVLWQE